MGVKRNSIRSGKREAGGGKDNDEVVAEGTGWLALAPSIGMNPKEEIAQARRANAISLAGSAPAIRNLGTLRVS